MKKSSKPTQHTWLFAVLISGSVLGYVFLIFLPGQRATASLYGEFIDKQNYVVDCHQFDSQIADVEAELKRTNNFIDDWRNNSCSEARLAHVFVEITEDAEQAGAEIVRFEPQPVEMLDSLQRIPVQMACEGNFVQLFNLLTNLEALAPDFWITDLKVEPVSAQSERLRCELSLAFFAGKREISD